MRLTIFLLTAAALHVSAGTVSQNVRFTGTNVPLEKVLASVEKQTGYVFLYTESVLKTAKPVTIDAENLPLEIFLHEILKNQDLEFAIKSKTIILSRAHPKEPGRRPEDDLRPDKPGGDVQGRVVDADGKPLMGATIAVKGSSKGTVSAADGSFVLHDANTDDIIVVSFMGYRPHEVKAQPGNRTYVVLQVATDPLDEVQIIAYGSTTKRMSLGSVTSVKSADIQRQPVNNVLLALQGRVPGMQITPVNNSLPGSAPKIQIRGINSIAAGTTPLFILDGIPLPENLPTINGIITESALITINPADIESVDVLKDAEATAIYGSRGANGVILITTKKGRPGKTNFDINAWTGFAKVARKIPVMDVHQYNAMRREAFANDGITPTALNAPDLFSWDTVHVRDWQKEAIGKTAITHDVNMSVSGGDVNTRFLLSGGYHKDGTTMPGDFGASRKSLRFTVDHNSPNGRFGMNSSVAFVNNVINLPATDLSSLSFYAPSYPLYTAAGQPNFNAPSGYPFSYTLQPFDNKTNNYNGHINLRYTPLKGLNLKVDMGYNASTTDDSQLQPSSSLPANQLSSANIRTTTSRTWIAEPQADYTIHLRRHTITALAGGTWQQNNMKQLSAMGTGFSSDALLGNISSAATITTSNNETQYAYNSFFSRINYNYAQQYLVNLSFRRDGSSRFGPGKRFGNFGSVAAGWIFTENKHIKEALPFLSFGKLRSSYGINGNDQIQDYGYITTYSSSQPYQLPTLIPNSLANPDYRWEENRKWEAAIELGAFKDRLLFSAAYFRNRTDNQLIQYVISPQSGFMSYPANFPALLQNTGWEFDLQSKNITTKDFSWKTTINFSFTRNKLLSFPNIDQTGYSGQYFVGQPLTVRLAYHFKGLDNKGLPVLDDLDKDNTISSKDRYIVGSNNPLLGGMSNDIGYKDFRLGFFIEYTHINGFDNTITASRVGAQNANPLTLVLDRWQKPGDEQFTNRPRFTTSAATYNARNLSQSDLYWTTYNIFRLRNVSLSYNLPASLLKKAHVKNMQIYALGQNVFVFDRNKYRLDPETGNTGMPPLRIITFGLNCTL